MASLKVQKDIKLIDEYANKGISRLYRHKKANALRKDFYRSEGAEKVVLDYIFGTGELPEELENIIKSVQEKEPVHDDGTYIYDEEEIERFGVPPGDFITRIIEDEQSDTETEEGNNEEKD